jgi:hypothetical protein
MTRADALQRLKKLGLQADVGPSQTSPERRANAKEQHARAVADAQDLERRIEAQFGAERKAIRRRREQECDAMMAYKFRVYRVKDAFWEEVAQGDTWEEAFAQLPTTAPKATATNKTTPETPF